MGMLHHTRSIIAILPNFAARGVRGRDATVRKAAHLAGNCGEPRAYDGTGLEIARTRQAACSARRAGASARV
jgi:hypothetical protein